MEICIEPALDNAIVDLIMHQDIGLSKFEETKKTQKICALMLNMLIKEMEAHNIEFKRSSKYFLQAAFIKMQASYASTNVVLFFQLLGTSQKKIIKLSNVVFLRSIITI